MANQSFAIAFTDLVHSTKIKSLLPGDTLSHRNQTFANEILIPHRQRTSQLIAAHHGTEVRFDGDGFVLTFPQVVDAARFAVQVQRSHAVDPIQTPLGPLQMRIGIHFGAPEEDPLQQGDYVGQEVDFASRLMSVGSPGQIVLSELAANLLRQALMDRQRPFPHGDRELKGIGRVPIFELLYDDKQPQALSQAALAPSNLPTPPQRVVGREAPLIELRERIHRGGAVVLKSEGGMGKTTLALAASHAALRAGELPGGVAWISCEFKHSFVEFLRQTCHVFFGDRLEDEPATACSQRILEHLKATEALVVLDNFESVARDGEYLRWIASIRPPQRVLLTTREASPSLQAAVVPVAELARKASSQLFNECCEHSGRKLLQRDESLVDQLCEIVGDHPLAIEILATRAARVPLAALLQRVSTDLNQAVAQNNPLRPERQQSLQASFALSFEPLSAAAQQLLIQTSILPASISPDLLRQLPVEGDPFTAAEELVDASLWRLRGDRYQVHSLVRQAAWERLPAQAASDVRLAVVGAVAKLATVLDRRLQQSLDDGLKLRDALDLQESELPNFLLAADVAHQGEMAELLDRLIDSLEYFWRVRGQWHAALRLSQLSLTMSRSPLSPMRRAKLLQGIGRAHRHLMQFPEAEAAYLEAVSLYEQAEDRLDLGEALSELSRVYSWMDRLEDSYSAAERAVSLLRGSSDGKKLATALARSGVVRRLRGDLAAAYDAQTESLELCRRLRDRRGEGRSWGYLGDCYRHQQNWIRADEAQTHSLAIARELNDRRAEGDTLLRMGKSLVAQQRWAEAEAKLQESLAIYREINSQSLQARTLFFYAQALQQSGRLQDALAAINEAASLLSGQSVGWFAPRVEALRAELMAGQPCPTKSSPSAIIE